MKEIFVELNFAIEDLKTNKLSRIFFAIQQSQEKFAEYTFVIGFYKVERYGKFNFHFGVVIDFNVSLK